MQKELRGKSGRACGSSPDAADAEPTVHMSKKLAAGTSSFHAANDDLVGCFNSVPQDILIDAVHSLTAKWNITFDTPTLTVHIQATGNPIQLSHIGQHHRRHPTQHTVDTNDIPPHCAHSAGYMHFPSLHHLLQTKPRGWYWLPTSLALCNVAITLIEHSWTQLHHSHTDHSQIHFAYYRYVDKTFPHHIGIQTLIHPDFFGNPIELEPVKDVTS